MKNDIQNGSRQCDGTKYMDSHIWYSRGFTRNDQKVIPALTYDKLLLQGYKNINMEIEIVNGIQDGGVLE